MRDRPGRAAGAEEEHPRAVERPHLLERAHGGTLFLDEIAELTPAMQVRLLRVLQDRQVQRLGSEALLSIDVRVICATHRDLQQLVQQGRFREDLYYRIHVVHLRVPPLRERPDDVLWLAQRFLLDQARERSEAPRRLTPAARAALLGHAWPGNVRELRNVVERAVYRCDRRDQPIADIEFDPFASPWRPPSIASAQTAVASNRALQSPVAPASAGATFKEATAAFERQLLTDALARHRYNQRAAAKALALSYDQLRHALRRHGLLEKASDATRP